MTKTEEAANLFVEKLRDLINENPSYRLEGFDFLVFQILIETLIEVDSTKSLDPEEVFLYAEKRLIDLQIEQLKKE